MSYRVPLEEYHDAWGNDGILWVTYPDDAEDQDEYIAAELKPLPRGYYGV